MNLEFMLDPLNLLAAAITILGGAAGLLAIFRQRQFSKQKLEFFTGFGKNIASSLPAGMTLDAATLKEFHKDSDIFCRYVSSNLLAKHQPIFSVVYLPVSIENKGTKSASNVQLILDYPSANTADLEDIYNASKHSRVTLAEDVTQQLELNLPRRQVESGGQRRSTTTGETTTTVLNFPIVRPGEKFYVLEPLRLNHAGYTARQQSPNVLDPVKRYYDAIEDKEMFRDFFRVTLILQGEDFLEIEKKCLVVSLCAPSNSTVVNQAAVALTNALWLGKYPSGEKLWRPRGYAQFLRAIGKKWILSSSLMRRLPLVLSAGNPALIQTQNGRLLVDTEEEPSFIGFGVLDLPNVDLFGVPDEVVNTGQLIASMGYLRVRQGSLP